MAIYEGKNGEIWDEIFRAGTHTDMAGNTHTFSEAELDKTVALFVPEKHEPPVVIGHPRTDAPAYGWVDGLKRVGKSLYARYRDMAPEFVEMLKSRRFAKKSAKFYPDGTLRHVGYLGAQPPAIKGLANFAFTENDEGSCFEFAETNPGSVRRLFAGIRDFFIEKFGLEVADKALPAWDINDIEVPASATPLWTSSFAEGDAMSREQELEKQLADERKKSETLANQFAEAQTRLSAIETENVGLKKAQADAAAAARTAQNKAFCEGLVKEGRMRPCDVGNVLAFMETLAPAGELEFAEGEKTSKRPALDAFKAHLSAQPKVVEFGEHAPGASPAQSGASAASKLDVLTREKLKAKPELGYAMAFAEVQTENPELANEYRTEINQ